MPVVPIVLGVVGHRDVRDEDRGTLHQSLVDLFKEFLHAYPSTSLVVVTSLAEGADQIAAEAALEAGAFVRAPLPFDKDDYARSTSFDTDESRARFLALIDDPRVESFVVPLPGRLTGRGPDWGRVATTREDGPDKELRYACYANAGGYLTRRCHALVALWDGPVGSPSQGPSGTEEHVAFKLKGRPPKYYPWADAEPLGFRGERGLVIVVHTPRAKSTARGHQVGDLRVLVPNERDATIIVPPGCLPLASHLGPWTRFLERVATSLGRRSHHDEPSESEIVESELRQFRDLCTTVDSFNHDLTRREIVAKVLGRRLADPSRFLVPEFDADHNRWLLRLTRVREGAAALSGHLQPHLDRAIPAVFILLGLSAFAFHVYAHVFQIPEGKSEPVHQPLLLFASTALLLATAAVISWYWWSRLEQRRLDSRALAEALRVRRTWSMAGVGQSVADSYVSQLRGEVSWIRQALLHVCPPPRIWVEQFDRLDASRQVDLLRRVREEWITREKGGQIPQFAREQKKMHAAASRWRQLGFWLAVLGWASLVALLIIGAIAPIREVFERFELTPNQPAPWFLVGSGVLVIVGGLLIAYCERCAYEDLAKQYERMLIVFHNGDRELAERLDRGDVEGARRVFEALGREAIVEHSQWLLLRRARPLELHIGG